MCGNVQVYATCVIKIYYKISLWIYMTANKIITNFFLICVQLSKFALQNLHDNIIAEVFGFIVQSKSRGNDADGKSWACGWSNREKEQ